MHPSLPARDLKEFIEVAKKAKGGSPEELASRMRKDAATNATIVAEAKIKAE